MSELFQQAVAQSLPLLKSIESGVKPPPKASLAALKKLKNSAKALPPSSPTPIISAEENTAVAWPGDGGVFFGTYDRGW